MDKKLRVGIIGAGFFAAIYHVPLLRATGRAEVAAIARRNPERLALVQRELGVPEAYTDWRVTDRSLKKIGKSEIRNMPIKQAYFDSTRTFVRFRRLLIRDTRRHIMVRPFKKVLENGAWPAKSRIVPKI